MTAHLVMLFLSACVVGAILWSWHSTSEVTFDLRYILVDSKSEKVSLMKIGQATALVVSTWGFIVLISRDKLSEAYFFGYMGAWAGANLANKFIELKQPKEKE